MLLLPGTDLAGALTQAERLRADVEASRLLDDIPVTISIGVAAAQPGVTIEHLVRDADLALYQAKKHGRNRVEPTQTVTHLPC